MDSFYTLFSNPRNYGSTRSAKSIKYLVFHYTANKTDTAYANANYFKNNVVKASAHYFVDDNNVYQSVPDLRVAWSVGGAKWADCKQTGGGTMYWKISNSNSINIEMCSKNGVITEKTQQNAILLATKLMRQYGIPIGNCYRHFDRNGKHCPGWTGWWGSNQTLWYKFKANLSDAYNGKTTNASTTTTKTTTKTSGKLSVDEVAKEVLAGKWGNGAIRKSNLIKAGYDYSEVQKKVTELKNKTTTASTKKSIDTIAREVIAGKWGNGSDRTNRLEKAGYDPTQVQHRVNELLK